MNLMLQKLKAYKRWVERRSIVSSVDVAIGRIVFKAIAPRKALENVFISDDSYVWKSLLKK